MIGVPLVLKLNRLVSDMVIAIVTVDRKVNRVKRGTVSFLEIQCTTGIPTLASNNPNHLPTHLPQGIL